MRSPVLFGELDVELDFDLLTFTFGNSVIPIFISVVFEIDFGSDGELRFCFFLFDFCTFLVILEDVELEFGFPVELDFVFDFFKPFSLEDVEVDFSGIGTGTSNTKSNFSSDDEDFGSIVLGLIIFFGFVIFFLIIVSNCFLSCVSPLIFCRMVCVKPKSCNNFSTLTIILQFCKL